MKKPLPLLISVPHAGLDLPPAIAPFCLLTPDQIREESDGGARTIYGFADQVRGYLSTETARIIVDLNRSPRDRRPHGVIKQRTFHDAPVYRQTVPDRLVKQLLKDHYYPYHRRLRSMIASGGFLLGVDCHTMAGIGPALAPDPGQKRPWVCLSNGHGGTCPTAWFEGLARALESCFDGNVALNQPYAGGYITCHYGQFMPWVQIELSREPFMSDGEKREQVLAGLRLWLAKSPETSGLL